MLTISRVYSKFLKAAQIYDFLHRPFILFLLRERLAQESRQLLDVDDSVRLQILVPQEQHFVGELDTGFVVGSDVIPVGAERRDPARESVESLLERNGGNVFGGKDGSKNKPWKIKWLKWQKEGNEEEDTHDNTFEPTRGSEYENVEEKESVEGKENDDNDGLESFTFGDESLSKELANDLHEICGNDDMHVDANVCDVIDIEFVNFFDDCLDNALYIHDLIGKDRSEGVENENVKEEVEDKKKTRKESVREEVEEKVSHTNYGLRYSNDSKVFTVDTVLDYL
nr:hypothetical protein Iba_chr09dCG10020 [Ipomoea batatas]